MAKVRNLGPRPSNEGWGPGRTHGGVNPDGPPKVEDPQRSDTDLDFVPFWREGRLGKANVETRNKPPKDPNAYARSMGLPIGTMRPAEALTAGKDNPDEFP